MELLLNTFKTIWESSFCILGITTRTTPIYPLLRERILAAAGAVTAQNTNPTGGTPTPSKLYNGNIHNMTTALRDFDEAPITVLSNNYQYDQLQRIRSMKVYESPSDLAANNHFNDVQLHNSGAYQTSYTFDKNGNLKTLDRYGDDGTLKMDEFAYQYYNTSDNTASMATNPNESNRLASVLDNITLTGNYTDIDIDAGQVNNNYLYDASGQLISDEQEGIQEIVWSVTGKVKEIKFTTAAHTSGKSDLKFVYDPMDMRVMKIEYLNEDRTDVKYTYYACDAQGNTLATYNRTIREPAQPISGVLYQDKYTLSENMIYGSSRLGIHNRVIEITTASITQPSGGRANIEIAENFVWQDVINISYSQSERVVAQKYYELSNHLGNVLEVISDRKTWIDNNSVHVYSADVVSYSDYFPYGMLLPGRNGQQPNTENYRYSFQNQETDDEIKGKGNSVNYKYRMHDPRIGRFFAVDPLFATYPMLTPYQFSSNSPIALKELEGMEGTNVVNHLSETTTIKIDILYVESKDKNCGSGFSEEAVENFRKGLSEELSKENFVDERHRKEDGSFYDVEFDIEFIEISTMDEAIKMRTERPSEVAILEHRDYEIREDANGRQSIVLASTNRGVLRFTSSKQGGHTVTHEIFHLLVHFGDNKPIDVMKGFVANDQGPWHNGKYGGGIFTYGKSLHLTQKNITQAISHTVTEVYTLPLKPVSLIDTGIDPQIIAR